MRLHTPAVLLLFVLLPPGRAGGQQLSAADRAQLVAMVWSDARSSAAAWPSPRADWDSALGATLRAAAPPQPDLLFYRRLARLLALLNDGQARVLPPPALRSRVARPPLLVTSVEHRPFVLDYAENDEMRVARPERLAEIVAVQGIPAAAWIADSIVPEIAAATPEARWARAVAAMLDGEKGTALHLQLRVPGGEQRGLSVTRSVSLADHWPLEPPILRVDSLPDGIVVVRVTALSDPDVVQQFDHAFPAFGGVRGLILDLRGASGDLPGYGDRILARLTIGPFPTVLRRTPQFRPGLRALGLPDSAASWYTLAADTIAPRSDRPAYTGPIAVLSSALTAGAAEGFLAAFRNISRGVIIGTTSAGSPGAPLDLGLVKRWTVRLSATRDAFPDGADFSGIGVAPEIPVVETVSDFLAGRDATLERARAYVLEARK